MGGHFSPKVSMPRVSPTELINDKSIPEGFKDSLEVPDDQFLCPLCERIPELLNVHTDNGHIELKCKYHGILNISIEKYYKSLKDSLFTYYKSKCANCNKVQGNKGKMFSYCYYCKVDFCDDCAHDFHLEKFDHRRNHLDVCIPVNEKPHRCLEHCNSDIISFCVDCQENICGRDPTIKHRGHQKINFISFEADITKYKEIIVKKNKILSDIIRFNQVILNTYDSFQNNYFHIQSLINLGKSLEEEGKRDPKELECMINRLEKSHKAQKEAIKSLQDDFKIDLNGEEIKVYLRKKKPENKLNDRGFKLVSLIQFKRLIDLDVSSNNIQSIEPLNNMNLPHLKYINMSDNIITDIKPLAELNSKKLKEICLQNNKIEDFSPFLTSEFPSLERLRIEGNNFDKDAEEFKQFLKKYTKKIIYIAKSLKEFNTKYNVQIDEKMNIVDLTGLRAGDDLLQELYLILTPDKPVKKLILQNNEIKDASLISRMPLRKVELLDLSLNEITNLKFLTEMKCINLKELYLNDNKINDITPLIQFNDPDLFVKGEGVADDVTKRNFPNLNTISLKNNNLIDGEKQNQKVLEDLKVKNITTDIKNVKESKNIKKEDKKN